MGMCGESSDQSFSRKILSPLATASYKVWAVTSTEWAIPRESLQVTRHDLTAI